MSGFDLSTAPDVANIEDEGVTIHLRDERGELMYADEAGEQPVTWTTRGTYSHTYRKVIAEQKRRLGKKLRRGDDVTDATDGNDVEAMVACCASWTGFLSGGKPWPCEPKNVRAVVESPKAQHIVDQVARAMGDHERFFAKPSAA